MTQKEQIEEYYRRLRGGKEPSGPSNGFAHEYEFNHFDSRNIRSRNRLPDDEARIARGDYGNPYYNG